MRTGRKNRLLLAVMMGILANLLIAGGLLARAQERVEWCGTHLR